MCRVYHFHRHTLSQGVCTACAEPECIPFHRQQCRVYTFSSTTSNIDVQCSVYPFSPPDIRRCRVYFFPPPAVWRMNMQGVRLYECRTVPVRHPIISTKIQDIEMSYIHYYYCRNFSCKLETIHILYIPWLWIYIKVPPRPPPSPQKRKQNCVSDGREEGGFHAECRGNVLLCPKSDESKKCLVLFCLFTLWGLVSNLLDVQNSGYEKLVYN